MANKIKVMLSYNLCDESEDYKFGEIDPEIIKEFLGELSISEFLSSLDDKAVLMLTDDKDKIIGINTIKLNLHGGNDA